MNVIKRNGSETVFDVNKIIVAITKANNETINAGEKSVLSEKDIVLMANAIEFELSEMKHAVSVEDIQDIVESYIMQYGAFDVAKRYVRYRHKRELLRNHSTTEDRILSILNGTNEDIKQENSNKNPLIAPTQRDYMAGEISKDLTFNSLLDSDIVDAHKNGLIHFHDADYFAMRIHNCCLVNLEDMLNNGTVIGDTKIEKPHSFATACNIATQIIAQVASNQYGGQTISLSHLAPFVQVSRNKIRSELIETFNKEGIVATDKQIDDIVESRVKTEIKNGVQTIQYQLLTLMTTNGQTPFVTIFMYLNEVEDGRTKDDLALIIEETLKQRIKGIKNEKGVYVTPAFPKVIYVLEDDNIEEGSRYYELTKLAAKCTAKRLVPDYISEKIMLRDKITADGNGNVYPCMGCRSFLTPYLTKEGKPKYYGRFNQGVVTINLIDVALSAGRDIDKFWDILDDRAELCHRALQRRHERLTGTPTSIAPILWRHGALARLGKDDTIDELLHNGYSTLSLGYAGLWETVYALIGKKLTDPEGERLGLKIMEKLNYYTKTWKEAEKIDYSIYGTPIESVTYKFAKCLRKRFGIIKGVTDKNYITNSYHIHVTEKVDAFTKLATEAKFQKLSPGGAISYVEVPNLQNNIDAVLSIMRFIYDNIMYAELNTKSDFCQVCSFDGEIQIVTDDNGKLIWECPNCGNRDQDKMSVARRTCGYIGSQFWNQGRTQEIKERVLHVD